MKTYTLQRTGHPPLRFDGELIAEADTEHLEALRWYSSAIYRSVDQFVVSVGFRSNWDGEAEHDSVFVCDSTSGVISALRAYDVLPPGRGYPSSEQYRDRQAKLRSHLQRDYDGMVTDLLDIDLFVETLGSKQESQGHGRDWDVFNEFLAVELASIPLTRQEACAICDANNGAELLSSPWAAIVPNVMDTDGLDAKWGVDSVQLAKRLRHLTRGELFALAVGAARFWRHTSLPTDTALKKAGFVV